MIKAGIMVKEVGISQLGLYLISSINTLVHTRPDLDVIVFYQTWAPFPALPRFGLLLEREMVGLQGTCISTDLTTTQRLLKAPGPERRLFYVWNMEWMDKPNMSYAALNEIYNHPSLELIARSEYHAHLLEKLWKKPAYIMEDFDPTVLAKILT
jgi:hypothetical protein